MSKICARCGVMTGDAIVTLKFDMKERVLCSVCKGSFQKHFPNLITARNNTTKYPFIGPLGPAEISDGAHGVEQLYLNFCTVFGDKCVGILIEGVDEIPIFERYDGTHYKVHESGQVVDTPWPIVTAAAAHPRGIIRIEPLHRDAVRKGIEPRIKDPEVGHVQDGNFTGIVYEDVNGERYFFGRSSGKVVPLCDIWKGYFKPFAHVNSP